jgi:chromosomal replication initiation ATPase DnaA
MNDIDQRLTRVRSLFEDFHREASKLLRDLSSITGTVAVGTNLPKMRPRLACIQQTVADLFAVPVTIMQSKVRTNDYAVPRQLSMMLCRELTTHSLEVIGAAHGGRDHGTVTHAVKAITNRVSIDREFAARVATAREKCTERLGTLDLPLFHR